MSKSDRSQPDLRLARVVVHEVVRQHKDVFRKVEFFGFGVNLLANAQKLEMWALVAIFFSESDVHSARRMRAARRRLYRPQGVSRRFGAVFRCSGPGIEMVSILDQ